LYAALVLWVVCRACGEKSRVCPRQTLLVRKLYTSTKQVYDVIEYDTVTIIII
jgi:hypothetical protein